ncbi:MULTISPECIES: WbqC family protein [unclassified Haematospirillum]|uniref:WbqC family protein n=1 Tax=unclassified Haematospirillum TaxID=2622088 RepID=UPI001438F066|nr:MULTISPECIES: WbqC family protein [unclassified Haematospirillum]NKD55219.1 WbqC family protein [Haematospirillum sp. H4890]NKD75104.1 WbqC family protein [Haematospirillum sp. H4485]
MKVASVQSSFIPWRGYFDIIASVDLFVFLDDVQYTVRDWRSRNKIKTSKGAEWLTVPVVHEKQTQRICDTRIQNAVAWQKKHRGTWSFSYRSAPYFDAAMDVLSGFDDVRHTTISQLNIYLIRRICAYLDIKTPMILSSELSLQGTKTGRLVDMIKKLGATIYLSGPSADAYLDKGAFRDHGIQLEYKSYDYDPYPQLWGDFIGGVTVLDLIANCGHQAKHLVRSRTPSRIIVAK